MSLEISDPGVERLAREVAEATGETEAQALKHALEERLERVRPGCKAAPVQVDEAERRRRYEAPMGFGRYFRSLPILDPRSVDEILDYDENGLPR